MLDKISKRVLKFLDSEPCNCYMYLDEERLPHNLQNEEEFFSAVRYLEKRGLVEIVKNQKGTRLGVQLSHTGTHRKEFSSISLIEYFKDKWIAILALAISIIALIRS